MYVYLLQCMEKGSRALDLGSSFQAQSYRDAIDALKGRFAKEGTLIECYVRDLIQIVVERVTKTNWQNYDYHWSSIHE